MNLNTAMNTKELENKVFFDKWAESYDWPLFQFWMRRFYRPLLQNLSQEMKDSDSLLDTSCGSGEFLRELSQKGKGELHGMDFSEEMVQKARNKLTTKAHLRQGDVHQLPYPENTFDYVVSTEAFHHYHDQKKALSEMKRVVIKGGKVIVVDIHFILPFIHRLFERFEPGCVKIHSRKELKELFVEAGLHNIQQQRSFLFAIETRGIK